MNILIVDKGKIPVKLYGGTERVIWSLGKILHQMGHKPSYLVGSGSTCSFASVNILQEEKPLAQQIPKDIDIIHFNFIPSAQDLEAINIPYIITMHGNHHTTEKLDQNIVFVSKNHAMRYGAETYVHNGLDWSEYSKAKVNNERKHFHFLGKAAWRIKNVKGAIDVVKKTRKEQIAILGGKRFNVSMGVRFTFTPKAQFYGMVGGKIKDDLLQASKGLIFPVRWHEPFGLAIIESLYFGCPVFATPYGSLPELVPKEVGFLSNSCTALSQAIQNTADYSPKYCNEYAIENFNAKKMTENYIVQYERVLSGKKLNKKQPQLQEVQQEKFLEWKV